MPCSRYESSEEPRFTLDDHRHQRADAPMHPLFHALRQAVLALNPSITMSCHRHYISFKVHGKNFADCEVQKQRIRVVLNLRFRELEDPEGLVENTTSLGRWGNDDAEISIDHEQGLPYLMSLIQQTLDRQMTASCRIGVAVLPGLVPSAIPALQANKRCHDAGIADRSSHRPCGRPVFTGRFRITRRPCVRAPSPFLSRLPHRIRTASPGWSESRQVRIRHRSLPTTRQSAR